MKTNFVRAALACLALALSSTAAMAAIDPIPGVDIIVKKNPGGSIVMHTRTSPTGQVQFKNLLPGDYVIEIDGNTLVKATERLTPSAPARHDSGPSRGPVGGSHNGSRAAATINGNLQITQFSMRRDGGSGGSLISHGYSRDAASRGIHIEFTVPRSGSYTATINWGDGTPN